MPLNAFATHRLWDRAYHGQKPHPWLPRALGRQTSDQRVCGSTTGHWGSGDPTLTLSLRCCRATTYPSSVVPRFTTMLLSPRPFGSRVGVHLEVICPALRPPQVAIPSVRDTAHAFTAHGSRERDIYGHVHFARIPPNIHGGQLCAFPGYLCLVSLPSPLGPALSTCALIWGRFCVACRDARVFCSTACTTPDSSKSKSTTCVCERPTC